MTGLVGWWPLSEHDGRANDLSGNGNHGTLNNGVLQGVAGKAGLTAYDFDGSDDYVDVSSIGNFAEGTKPFTMAIWGRTRTNNSNEMVFSHHYDMDNRIELYFGGNGPSIWWEKSGATASHSAAGETDTWYHIVLTFDGTTSTGYIDGEAVSSTDFTADMASGSVNVHVGQQARNANQLNGQACDARIYNRALSPQEVKELYEWGAGDYTDRNYHNGTDTGAVSRWKFNDDSDTSNAVDSWSSNSGDISGAVYSSDAARGKSLSFDGSNDSVSVSSQELDISDSKSVSAWVKMEDAASSEYQRLFQTGTNSGGRAYEMWIEDENSGVSFGRAVFRLNHDQSPSSKTCEYVIPDFGYDQWYHYTTVYDYENGEMRIYINGALRQVVSYSQQIGSETDHYIGNWADEGDRPWNGLIDDVRVYDRALDSSEVFQLYQWGTRGRDMRKITVNARGD